MPKNALCAKIFYEIADILEMQDVQWKPIAYRKAARTIESLSKDVEEIYARGGVKALQELPGIGEAISGKTEEIIKTGTLHYYEELKKEAPFDMEAITAVPGVGPKKAMKLYKELGVKTAEDLKRAAEEEKIREIPGFDAKSEENILKGLALVEKTKGRALLGTALEEAERLVAKMRKSGLVERISYAGSLRRMKETVGDIDVLVTSRKPEEVMDYFVKLPEIAEVVAKGPTKTAVRLGSGIACDVRVVEDDAFGSALQYFTGSKEHNIALRRIAISKGWKLSEYGIFKGAKRIAGKDEEDVYAKLGLEWVPPELRENSGEIEAAQKGRLPKLLEAKDIRGDFHCHTKWSDGSNSIEEMAAAAQKLGYEYIAITDHASKMGVARGLKDRDFAKQRKEVEKVQKGTELKIMHGAEVDIEKDGSLFLKNETMKGLDLVVAAVHSNFSMPKEEMTERMVRAMENEHVDIIGHPSGRLIGEREPYEVDYEKLFEAAKRTGTAMEINAYPTRLDLWDTLARQAKERGVKLAIGTDAHSTEHLRFMSLGVATARRGWCGKGDVLNTLGFERLGKVLTEARGKSHML